MYDPFSFIKEKETNLYPKETVYEFLKPTLSEVRHYRELSFSFNALYFFKYINTLESKEMLKYNT